MVIVSYAIYSFLAFFYQKLIELFIDYHLKTNLFLTLLQALALMKAKIKQSIQQNLPYKTFQQQTLKDKIQNQHFLVNKTVTYMNSEDSFPVFDLQIDCEFQSSDEKFHFPRKQNQSQTTILEEGNLTALSTIGKRNANLDTFSYLKRGQTLLLGVYDGHGDDKVAKYLQENLLQRLIKHEDFDIDVESSIKSILKLIEEQVLQIYDKGSTVLLAIITETEIIAANIGDSKLFGIRKDDGTIVSMTRQHDLSQQSEVAQIMSKGGLIFKRGNQYRINGELNVSRSLGDKKHKQYMSSKPDLYRFDKSEFKKIMLTTDGFYRHELFESELCKRSVKEIENKIRKGIMGYGFDDNATVLAVRFKSASPNSTMEQFFSQKGSKSQ